MKRQFPGKLHDMMTYVEQEGLGHIVSWIRNGRGFMVHDPETLVEILPLFFSQTKYRSFVRQLNMWHFQRVLDNGSCKGAWVHPYFLRGHKLLCGEMSRHSKLPLSSYPIKSTQLEAPWHITGEIGESSVAYPPSRGAISSPSCSSASTTLHDCGKARMRSVIGGPRHIPDDIGETSVDYPSRGAISSPFSSSASALNDSGVAIIRCVRGPHQRDASLALPSTSEEVDSERKIRAKKREQQELRDGALTYFAGRQFYFLEDALVDDDSPPSTITPERI